jgi:hypothetical protein
VGHLRSQVEGAAPPFENRSGRWRRRHHDPATQLPQFAEGAASVLERVSSRDRANSSATTVARTATTRVAGHDAMADYGIIHADAPAQCSRRYLERSVTALDTCDAVT